MIDFVIKELKPLILNESVQIDENTKLIGSGGVIDSLALVELCLRLEDAASINGFEFDWTSSNAMSRSTSVFRTVGSLAEEVQRQKNQK